MSSEKGASQNHTAAENMPIETCHQLLKSRDFISVRYIIHVNQLVSSKRHDDQFEQAEAICDVLIAAENRLPNGLKDYYGMIRVNRLGPVLLEDFKKLMKLLDKTHNHFPFSQEAADKALLAWSLLSKPPIKAHYDLAISAYYNRDITGGGLCRECSKGKRRMGLHESEYYWKGFPNSFIPQKQNVGPGPHNEVVISDDDGQEIITMARTAKLRIVNGRRVKLIPLKKKKAKDTV